MQAIGDTSRGRTAMGVLAAVTGQVIWGFSFIFSKTALRYATPPVLLSVRFLIAFALMNLLVCTGRCKLSLRGKHLGSLLLLGLLEPVLYFYCESYGILYTNATFAGVMVAMNPIVAMLMAAVLLRERPSRRQAVFGLLPILGVALITLSSRAEGAIRPIGVVILAGTCLCAGLSRVLSRRTAARFSSFERTYVMMMLGSVVFTASAVLENLGNPRALLAPLASGWFWASAFFLGALCSVASYGCVNFALERLPVARAAVFSSLTTVVSIFAGVIFLGEPITGVSVVGSILIIVGIWVVSS